MSNSPHEDHSDQTTLLEVGWNGIIDKNDDILASFDLN